MPVLTLPRSSKKRNDRWLDDPEVRLMLRVRDGDEDAFAQLTERYSARLFGFFCRRLGDRQEAEDLTQEVLLRLFRSRQRYEPRARFSTWVFHITQNVARNALRFRRRHPSVRLTAAADEVDLLAALLTGSARRRRGGWSAPSWRAWCAPPSPVWANGSAPPLELHQFQDQTYAEVAAQLDMTPKAAKSLLYRTRNLLRIRLTPLLGGE